MIDGTEKPKIPQKFAKCAARYNEFGSKVFSGELNEKKKRKSSKNASNAVFCFLISFYGLLKGYLFELTPFDLFGCGS